MRSHLLTSIALALTLMTQAAPADDKRTRDLVPTAEGRIDVITEGSGPLILLLPSRGRDSEDYDEVAEGLAQAGFRVLRPQPRGIGKSTGPMQGLTLHDFARDVAAVIRHYGGPAVIVGHAYGNWVARMTAVDHPELVRGVVIAAAAAKKYPPELSVAVTKSGDVSLPKEERLKYLRGTFFAPGNDPPSGSTAGTRRRAKASVSPAWPPGRTNGGRPARCRCSTCRPTTTPSTRSRR